MNKDPKLINSDKSQPVSSGGKTVFVEIYRMDDEDQWSLSIDDEFHNTSVWDDSFKSEESALIEAKKAILEDGIKNFIGPESGKGDWK